MNLSNISALDNPLHLLASEPLTHHQDLKGADQQIKTLFQTVLRKFDNPLPFTWQKVNLELTGKKTSVKVVYLCETELFKSGQSRVYPALKTSKAGFKFYVYLDTSEKKSKHQLPNISAEQIQYFFEATRFDIAPKCYQIKLDSSTHMLVKLVCGGDLVVFLKNNTHLTFDNKIFIARQMLLKLQSLHDRLNLTHFDISPSNILVDYNEDLNEIRDVFFCDFGLVKPHQELDILPGYNPQLPTPEMSFKIYQDEWKIDSKQVDLHLAGQTLFYLFTGKYFFKEYSSYKERLLQRDKELLDRSENVSDIEELSVLEDDITLNFLLFNSGLRDLPEGLIHTIRSLIRTLPESRSLEQALRFFL
jgi:serine/threonine protein kinase